MSPKPYWTKDLVFEAFSHWEREHGKLPTSDDWRKLSPDAREEKLHPTSRHVAIMFGTWRAALEEYEQQREKFKKRWKLWTPEEIVEAIQSWAADHDGMPPTYHDFSRKNHGGRLPSLTSVNSRMGGFRNAMEAAGFPVLPRGVTYASLARYRPLPRRGGK